MEKLEWTVVDGRITLEVRGVKVFAEGPSGSTKRACLEVEQLQMPEAFGRELLGALQQMLGESAPPAPFERAYTLALARVEVLAAELGERSKELIKVYAERNEAQRLAKDEAAARIEVEAERERWARDVKRAKDEHEKVAAECYDLKQKVESWKSTFDKADAERRELKQEVQRLVRVNVEQAARWGAEVNLLKLQRAPAAEQTIGEQLTREWTETGRQIVDALDRLNFERVPGESPIDGITRMVGELKDLRAACDMLRDALIQWRRWASRIVGEQPNDKGLRLAIDTVMRPDHVELQQRLQGFKTSNDLSEESMRVLAALNQQGERRKGERVTDAIIRVCVEKARALAKVDELEKLLGRIVALAAFEG